MQKNGFEETERLKQLKSWALQSDSKHADADYHDPASDRWLMPGTIVVLLSVRESDFPSVYNNDQDADMRSSPNWLLNQSNNDIWVDMHQTALNNIHYPDKNSLVWQNFCNRPI